MKNLISSILTSILVLFNGGPLYDIGKELNIEIPKDTVVNAQHLQDVLEEKFKTDKPYFNLWDKDELKKMIDYMDKNNLIITPGNYKLNQAWKFENGQFTKTAIYGLFKADQKETFEVFRFQKIPEENEPTDN